MKGHIDEVKINGEVVTMPVPTKHSVGFNFKILSKINNQTIFVPIFILNNEYNTLNKDLQLGDVVSINGSVVGAKNGNCVIANEIKLISEKKDLFAHATIEAFVNGPVQVKRRDGHGIKSVYAPLLCIPENNSAVHTFTKATNNYRELMKVESGEQIIVTGNLSGMHSIEQEAITLGVYTKKITR